jgi:hypothetical protein
MWHRRTSCSGPRTTGIGAAACELYSPCTITITNIQWGYRLPAKNTLYRRYNDVGSLRVGCLISMRRLFSGIFLFLAIPFAHAQSYVFFTFDPPGSTSTTVAGINNAGQIVGCFEDASGIHGFLRTGSTYTTIEVPGASRVRPGGINNRGEITGQFTDATGTHGFIRSAEGRVHGTLSVQCDRPRRSSTRQ